jgi:hypothetical protein
MTTRPDFEIDIGLRNAELREEHPRHACVVMLAGVHQRLFYIRPLLERPHDRRCFHKIRAGANYVKNAYVKGAKIYGIGVVMSAWISAAVSGRL